MPPAPPRLAHRATVEKIAPPLRLLRLLLLLLVGLIVDAAKDKTRNAVEQVLCQAAVETEQESNNQENRPTGFPKVNAKVKGGRGSRLSYSYWL